MDGAFASAYRILDENSRVNNHPAVAAVRQTAEEARNNVHRAADHVRTTGGLLNRMAARRAPRQAGYAARLALDTLIATADRHDGD